MWIKLCYSLHFFPYKHLLHSCQVCRENIGTVEEAKTCDLKKTVRQELALIMMLGLPGWWSETFRLLILDTGKITAQYHVVADDSFQTVDATKTPGIDFDHDDWYKTFGLTPWQYIPVSLWAEEMRPTSAACAMAQIQRGRSMRGWKSQLWCTVDQMGPKNARGWHPVKV